MSVDLYTSHFGFRERPFTLLPDPDFMYWSPSHMRAYTILEYGIATHAQLTVITGEVGAGKTTLVQKLLGTLDDSVQVGLISNAHGGRGDLIRWVLYSLGIEIHDNDDYVSMFKRFQDFVINEYAHGRHVILLIDEAQNLSLEALEELRMYTNINSNKDELLQLVLVGQPELRQMINDPRLKQFTQRISASYHLNPLDLKMTEAYVRHRLQHVGGAGDEITPQAIEAIFEESAGVPRLINKLCDMALVYAASSEKCAVDTDIIRELIADELFIKPKSADVLVLKNPTQASTNKVSE
jgi:general secretion pathway protein A